MTWNEIKKIENVEILEYIVEALMDLSEISNIDYYELEKKFKVDESQEENYSRDRKILFNIYQEIQKYENKRRL
jgi:hypothetical protein